MGSNPVTGTTNHKPAANSVILPSDAGKSELRGNSEGTGRKTVRSYQLYRCYTRRLRCVDK